MRSVAASSAHATDNHQVRSVYKQEISKQALVYRQHTFVDSNVNQPFQSISHGGAVG